MENCQNCSTPLQGKFCFVCGQKVIEPNERTVKHFVYQFFGSAFFLENNFAKNLWILLSKPGQIPLDFIEGRRKRWMPPFSLFLMINLFYFWYSPLTDLNLRLYEQIGQPHHKRWVEQLVNRKLEADNITYKEYETIYNQKSTGYANSLVILHIPIFAGFLSLIYYRKNYFFVDHFIYALYFLAFVLLLALIQTVIVYILIAGFGFGRGVFTAINFLVLAGVLFYGFLSLRKTYHQTNLHAALALPAVVIALGVTHLMYRTILFLIIYVVT